MRESEGRYSGGYGSFPCNQKGVGSNPRIASCTTVVCRERTFHTVFCATCLCVSIWASLLYYMGSWHRWHLGSEGSEAFCLQSKLGLIATLVLCLLHCLLLSSFVAGSDGYVYEGRGWLWQGAHTKGHNSKGYGVSFIGNYTSSIPAKHTMDLVRHQLAKCATDGGRLVSNFTLHGHRQLVSTSCPGDALYSEIHGWKHFAVREEVAKPKWWTVSPLIFMFFGCDIWLQVLVCVCVFFRRLRNKKRVSWGFCCAE